MGDLAPAPLLCLGTPRRGRCCKRKGSLRSPAPGRRGWTRLGRVPRTPPLGVPPVRLRRAAAAAAAGGRCWPRRGRVRERAALLPPRSRPASGSGTGGALGTGVCVCVCEKAKGCSRLLPPSSWGGTLPALVASAVGLCWCARPPRDVWLWPCAWCVGFGRSFVVSD